MKWVFFLLTAISFGNIIYIYLFHFIIIENKSKSPITIQIALNQNKLLIRY